MRAEPGQLRRWKDDSVVLQYRGELFTLLDVMEEHSVDTEGVIRGRQPYEIAWGFIVGGQVDWHFEDVISAQSELLSD